MGSFFFLNNGYFEFIAWPIVIVIVGFIASRLLHRDILFSRRFLLVKIGVMLFYNMLHELEWNWTLESPFLGGYACLALMCLIRQIYLYFLAKEEKAWLADLICLFFEIILQGYVASELIYFLGHHSYSVGSIMIFSEGLKFLGTAGLLFVNARPVQAIVAILAVYGVGLFYFRLISGQKDWYDRRFYLFKAALMVVYTLAVHDCDFRFIFRLDYEAVRWTIILLIVLLLRQLYVRLVLRRREFAAPDFVSVLSEPILITFALRMFEVYVKYGGKSSLSF